MSFFINALTKARKFAKAAIIIANFVLEVTHAIGETLSTFRNCKTKAA